MKSTNFRPITTNEPTHGHTKTQMKLKPRLFRRADAVEIPRDFQRFSQTTENLVSAVFKLESLMTQVWTMLHFEYFDMQTQLAIAIVWCSTENFLSPLIWRAHVQRSGWNLSQRCQERLDSRNHGSTLQASLHLQSSTFPEQCAGTNTTKSRINYQLWRN